MNIFKSTLSVLALSASVATFAYGDTTSDFKALLSAEREAVYVEYPSELPPERKVPIREMGKVTPADYARRAAMYADFHTKVLEIDRSALSKEDQLNYDLFAHIAKDKQLDNRYQSYRIPFYSDSGFHSYLPRMATRIRFKGYEDYDAYLERLSDVPRFFNDQIANLRAGMKDGFTMPKVVLDGLLPTFASPIVTKAEDSPFYMPFKKMVKGLTDEQKAELLARADDVIMNRVMAAYKALDTFMREEYYPAARDELAAGTRPGGKEYYPAMVKYYTTIDITPDEVHALGVSEVARIRAEMEQVIKDAKFEGSFAAFTNFLRTDPQFYAKTPKELLMHASYLAKLIDGRLPRLFGKMPRQPYGVEAVPDAIAPNYTTGRYVGSPLDAPRGGFYWVNTYALDKRPLYTLPALTLHEAVPGHHMQSALSKEMKDVPEFRKGYYPHAYGEGWGLYSEKLGLELDLYETPYDHFGRLSYEMWRACRLVIDTGIHWKGWTRERAIKLLEDNSALSTHNIRTEVDRYISWPGQALAYKMGELKLLELRARATKALGDKFDVRDFHEQVLNGGGMPLELLDRRINEWIESVKMGS